MNRVLKDQIEGKWFLTGMISVDISGEAGSSLGCIGTSTDEKQGRIHGNPVGDGWAGAVMQKQLGIQKCDGWTDGPIYLPTDTARC